MRLAGVLLCAAALLAGCTRGGGAEKPNDPASLTPEFVPATSTTAPGDATTAASSAPPTSVARVPSTSAAAPAEQPRTDVPTTTSVAAAAAPLTARVTDGTGDATPSIGDRAPRWADLAGGTLERHPDGFVLRITLADTAPATTDSDHTMNLASFYDTDGDGDIEYQVWANVSPEGWHGAYFDQGPDRGKNRFRDDSGVAITTAGNEVVLRFPLEHLRGAERFRWSLASEWAPYETLGTVAAARDDAPDNDGAVDFPQ